VVFVSFNIFNKDVEWQWFYWACQTNFYWFSSKTCCVMCHWKCFKCTSLGHFSRLLMIKWSTTLLFLQYFLKIFILWKIILYYQTIVESQSNCLYRPHKILFEFRTFIVAIPMKLINQLYNINWCDRFMYNLFFSSHCAWLTN
jgi:hypothetical protein